MGRISQAFRRRGGEAGQDDVNVTTVVHAVLTSYAPEDPARTITIVDDTVVSSTERRDDVVRSRIAAVQSTPSFGQRMPPSTLTGALSDRAALLHELVDAHALKVSSASARAQADADREDRGADARIAAAKPGADPASREAEHALPATAAAVPRSQSIWETAFTPSKPSEPGSAAPALHAPASGRQTAAPVSSESLAITGDSTAAAAVAAAPVSRPFGGHAAQATSSAGAGDAGDGGELIDTRQLGNYLGFVLRSVRRHWLMFMAVTLVMVSATIAAAAVWPKSYQVYATLLVQRNEKMASLVNPGRTISPEAESPIRAAEQIVLQQQNLRTLIEQTDLLFRWEQTRAPAFRLKDRVFAYLRGPQSPDDRVDSMVGLLESRLKVFTTPEGSITFQLNWPEPTLGYDIVDHAVQNFLEFRKQTETSAINDSIAILDQSVDTLEEKVRQTISELPKRRPAPVVRRVEEPAQPAPVVAAVVTPQAPPAELVNRLTRMKSEIETRRREVTRLEDLHRQQLSEAQTRLNAAKTVYGDDFPTVIALRQTVDQLSRESPELTALRRETQSAENEYDTLAAALQPPGSSTPGVSSLPPELQLRPALRASSELPPMDISLSDSADAQMSDPTTLRLRVELAELASVRGRANAARAELSSSQAGFKYQYTVITPPQMPRGPISPNVPAVIGGGLIASLLLALLAVVMADLLSDRMLESWQLEHYLGIPVGLSLQERQ